MTKKTMADLAELVLGRGGALTTVARAYRHKVDLSPLLAERAACLEVAKDRAFSEEELKNHAGFLDRLVNVRLSPKHDAHSLMHRIEQAADLLEQGNLDEGMQQLEAALQRNTSKKKSTPRSRSS